MADFELASIGQPAGQHSGALLALNDSSFLLLGGWTRGYLNTCEVDAYSRDCHVATLTHEPAVAPETAPRIAARWTRSVSRNANCLLPPRGGYSAVLAAGAVWLFGGGSLWSDGNTYDDLVLGMPSCLRPQQRTEPSPGSPSSELAAAQCPATCAGGAVGGPDPPPQWSPSAPPASPQTRTASPAPIVPPEQLWGDVTWSDVDASGTPPSPRQNHSMLLLPPHLNVNCEANAARGRSALGMAGIWGTSEWVGDAAQLLAASDAGAPPPVDDAKPGLFREQLLMYGGQSSATARGDAFLLSVEVEFPPDCPELQAAAGGENTAAQQTPALAQAHSLEHLLSGAHRRFQETGVRQAVLVSAHWQRLHVAPAETPTRRGAAAAELPAISSHCAHIVGDRMWVLGGVSWAGMGATVNPDVLSVQLPQLLWRREGCAEGIPHASHASRHHMAHARASGDESPNVGSEGQQPSLAARVAMAAVAPQALASDLHLPLTAPLGTVAVDALAAWATFAKLPVFTSVLPPPATPTSPPPCLSYLSYEACSALVSAGIVHKQVLRMPWLLRSNAALRSEAVPHEPGVGRLGRFAAASAVVGDDILVHGGWAFAEDHGMDALDTEDKSWNSSVLRQASGAGAAGADVRTSTAAPPPTDQRHMKQFFRPAERTEWAVRCGTSLVMGDVHALRAGSDDSASWAHMQECAAAARLSSVGPRMGHCMLPARLGGKRFLFIWGGHDGVTPVNGARLVPLDDVPFSRESPSTMREPLAAEASAQQLLQALRHASAPNFQLRVMAAEEHVGSASAVEAAASVPVHAALWLSASGAMRAQQRVQQRGGAGLFSTHATTGVTAPAYCVVVGSLPQWELIVGGLYEPGSFVQRCSQLSVPEVCQVLALLDEHEVTALIPPLEQHVASRLTAENVHYALGAADSLGLAVLMRSCAEFMRQHWQQLIRHEATHHSQCAQLGVSGNAYEQQGEHAPLLWAFDWLQRASAFTPAPHAAHGEGAEGDDDGSQRNKRPRRGSAQRAVASIAQSATAAGAVYTGLSQPLPEEIVKHAQALAQRPSASSETDAVPHPVHVWVAQSVLLGSFLRLPADCVEPAWCPAAAALYA